MRLFIIAAILLTSSVVFAQPLTMKVGDKTQVAATGRSAGAPANWVSSDNRIVSVINSSNPALNGTVRARRAGTATVTAVANGSSTSIPVTVTNGQ